MLDEAHFIERAGQILQVLYGSSARSTDPAVVERVCQVLGAPAPEAWPGFVATDIAAWLTQLGRTVCAAERPQCDHCELRKFCQTYRTRKQQEWAESDAPTVVDLFCGAGGASVGFVQAGFKVLFGVDYDPWALATFRLNHPELTDDRVISQDLFQLDDPAVAAEFRARLEALTGGREVDVVVGGPPCQGFSQAGTAGRNSARAAWSEGRFVDDPRNKLYRYFLLMVEWLQPRYVVMENVPAMLQIGKGQVMAQVLQDLRERGYKGPKPRIHDCYRYGVPQTRRRAIFLAGRADQPEFGDSLVQAPELHNLGDAIRDLTPLLAGTGTEVAPRILPPRSAYARELAAQTSLIHNHVARPHQASDLKLYSLLQPGEAIRDRPDLRYNPELMKYDVTKFKDTYKRQNYDTQATTVVAHLQKDGNMYIHPEQVRTFTVREAARVQSFPDDFIFCGTRTHQFRQVGNAIPPLFMRRIAAYVAHLMGRSTTAAGDLMQLVLDFDSAPQGE